MIESSIAQALKLTIEQLAEQVAGVDGDASARIRASGLGEARSRSADQSTEGSDRVRMRKMLGASRVKLQAVRVVCAWHGCWGALRAKNLASGIPADVPILELEDPER